MPQYDDFVIVICKEIQLRSEWFLNFIVVAFKLICTTGKHKESLKRVFPCHQYLLHCAGLSVHFETAVALLSTPSKLVTLCLNS